jgi:hypothetical protein
MNRKFAPDGDALKFSRRLIVSDRRDNHLVRFACNALRVSSKLGSTAVPTRNQTYHLSMGTAVVVPPVGTVIVDGERWQKSRTSREPAQANGRGRTKVPGPVGSLRLWCLRRERPNFFPPPVNKDPTQTMFPGAGTVSEYK